MANNYYMPRPKPKLASISIGEYFSRRAFEAERYFTSLVGARSLNFLPKSYCGFECETLRRKTVRCIDSYDSRAVVSLALLEKRSILLEYANKTPIMCINVSRFVYTLQAFKFVSRFSDPISEALDFFVKTDIRQLEERQERSTHRIPPNEQFSDLLHILRSSGYEQYIFTLAERLNFNVDLVKCDNGDGDGGDGDDDDAAKSCFGHDATRNPSKIVFRYTRVQSPPSSSSLASSSRKSSRAIASNASKSIGVGVITAVNYNSRWFVKVSGASILD